MFLGVLLWGVYFMNFRDFFRILVSRRRSLSYQERVKNIMFRYYVFNSLSFIFLIVGACVWVFKVHVSLCFSNFWYGIRDFFRDL